MLLDNNVRRAQLGVAACALGMALAGPQALGVASAETSPGDSAGPVSAAAERSSRPATARPVRGTQPAAARTRASGPAASRLAAPANTVDRVGNRLVATVRPTPTPVPTAPAGPTPLEALGAATRRDQATAGTGAAVAEVPKSVIVNPEHPAWRDPKGAAQTPYGELGKWMLKNGKIANWVGLPFCGAGADCGLLGSFKGKTVQEPINMVFVVKAGSSWAAEMRLDSALREAGFGPSPFSSIGYSGLVRGQTHEQMPRGGLLGFGWLSVPFSPIISLPGAFGVGAAYRNAPYNQANAHLRTFGGVPDGKGNYIFTASVSDEFLLTTMILGFIPNPIPTHGYQSFYDARETLTRAMIDKSGGTDMGLVDMQNQIPDYFPRYTTGDHDGRAQVIGIGSAVAPLKSRPTFRAAAATATR